MIFIKPTYKEFIFTRCLRWNILFLFSCLVLSSTTVIAQPFYKEGVIGGYNGGVHFINDGLELGMQPYLGADFQLNNFWTAGGGAKLLFKSKYVFGLEGQHLQRIYSYNNNGSISSQGGMTLLQGGYAVLNKEKWLGLVCLGYKTGKQYLLIKNTTEQSFHFNSYNVIVPQTSEEYTFRLSSIEMSMNINRMFLADGEKIKGGSTLGLETGVFYTFQSGLENNFNEPVLALDGSMSGFGYFFKLTFGGGLFFRE